MKLYYLISTLISCFIAIIFLAKDKNRKSMLYLKTVVIILAVSNLGYLLLAESTNLDRAILANCISYTGGCFMPPLMLMFCCSLCNFKIKNFIKYLIFAYSSFVYLLVLLVGKTTWYYRETFILSVNGTTVLGKDYAWGHTFFYILLVGSVIAEIVVMTAAVIMRRVTKKYLGILIVMETVTVICFICGRVINPYIEITPVIYVFDGIIILLFQYNLELYNIEDAIYEKSSNDPVKGYLMLDINAHLLGCSPVAANYFPELTGIKIDENIGTNPKTRVFAEFIDDFNLNPSKFSERKIEENGRFYNATITRFGRGTNAGFFIELADCTDSVKYQKLMEEYNDDLKKTVKEQVGRIKEIQNKTVLGIADMVENRDNATGGHIKRTSDVVAILLDTIKGNHLYDLSDEFCENLIKAAPMHDLGKIAVPDAILNKPGGFTDEEYEIMKQHATKSAEIVEKLLRGVEDDNFVNLAVNVARYHHEKYDGTGYPTGIEGNAIPLESRIMAIADVYDVLVSKRCYKEALSFEEADKIMLDSMGTHFDPKLKEVYIKSREKMEAYYKSREKTSN